MISGLSRATAAFGLAVLLAGACSSEPTAPERFPVAPAPPSPHAALTATLRDGTVSASNPEWAGVAIVTGTDLGLYSVTFLNDTAHDAHALEEFALFREEAASIGFRYFYEVFNPNVACGLERKELGEFMNDCILRSLAGLTKAERPEFLKIVYNGPAALEELASFDPSLVVGVLGGGAGTTRDTFELLRQAERYGGRVALFGRKINLAEAPLDLLVLMRKVVEGDLSSEEAVRAYHGELQKQKIAPTRSLDDDLAITEEVLKPAATKKAA